MSNWTEDELHRIAGADDLHISPLREDNVTHGTPLGSGRLLSEASCSCGPITARRHDGIEQRCAKSTDRSPQPG